MRSDETDYHNLLFSKYGWRRWFQWSCSPPHSIIFFSIPRCLENNWRNEGLATSAENSWSSLFTNVSSFEIHQSILFRTFSPYFQKRGQNVVTEWSIYLFLNMTNFTGTYAYRCKKSFSVWSILQRLAQTDTPCTQVLGFPYHWSPIHWSYDTVSMHLQVLIQASNILFDTKHKTGWGVLNPEQQRFLRSKFNDQTCQLLSPSHNKWKCKMLLNIKDGHWNRAFRHCCLLV